MLTECGLTARLQMESPNLHWELHHVQIHEIKHIIPNLSLFEAPDPSLKSHWINRYQRCKIMLLEMFNRKIKMTEKTPHKRR